MRRAILTQLVSWSDGQAATANLNPPRSSIAQNSTLNLRDWQGFGWIRWTKGWNWLAKAAMLLAGSAHRYPQ
jgi:hypothetical protein